MIERIRAVARRLAGIELWVAAGLAAASLFSERFAWIALLVAGAFWLVRWLAYGYLTVRTPIDWPLLLLALMVLVSLWATPLPAVTRRQASGLLIGIALYYSVVNWARSRVRLRHVTYGLILAGCVLALSAPFTVGPLTRAVTGLVPRSFDGSLAQPRTSPVILSDAINPNVMAGALLVIAPLAISTVLFECRRSRRRFRGREARWRALAAGMAALLMLLVLALTRSRGALLGLGAALILLVGLRWRWGWLLAMATGAAMVLGAWLVGTERVFAALSATQALGGLEVRLEVWSRALYMIQDFPFTGIGFGAFGEVANWLYPFFLVAPEAIIPHAHNLLLQIAVDLGLPGLFAWLAAWLVVCIAAGTVYRRGRVADDAWLAGIGAGLLGSQIALAVHGLTDAVTWGTRPALVVWVMWGLAIATWMLIRSERTS